MGVSKISFKNSFLLEIDDNGFNVALVRTFYPKLDVPDSAMRVPRAETTKMNGFETLS